MVQIFNNRTYTKLNNVENGEVVLCGGKAFLKVEIEGEVYALNLENYTVYKKDYDDFEYCDAFLNIVESDLSDNGPGKIIVEGDNTYIYCVLFNGKMAVVNIEDGIGKIINIEDMNDSDSNLILEINIE